MSNIFDDGGAFGGNPVTNPARPSPPSRTGSTLTDGLTTIQRDAFAALNSIFTGYGLGTLAPKIVEFLKAGYSADTIGILLQETSEYKTRFAANETRRKKGLPVLSPAEYLATETAYRQIMRSAGMPSGFYDQNTDFQKFLEDDVSPTEIQSRVTAAANFVNSASAEQKAAFSKWYSTGDMIAYALDSKRAEPLIEKAFQAASIGGEASRQGLDMDRTLAESVVDRGFSTQQAAEGLGIVASNIDNDQKLAAISGTDISAFDLMQEVFFNDATVTQKRNRLASQERGRFSGSSAVGSGSLGSSTSGQI